MKKPINPNPNPSKVIIIPQTPQNNMEENAPQDRSSVESPAQASAPVSAPAPAPASQQAQVGPVEEEDE